MTKHELKELTHKYWRMDWNEEDETRMEWYVSKLMPHELKYAEEQGTLKKKKCDLLVIILGLSFEPLLQSIVAYQPEMLLMVVNNKYNHEEDGEIDGSTYCRDCFMPALRLLGKAPTVLPQPMEIAGDDPVSVFRFLRQELLPLLGNEGKRNSLQVAIDITGAKKSMVAGAYLFAVFADVPVSYVDFDTYNPKEGKPYGYTCRIGELDSPTEKFRLRDWVRLEQLYEHYDFWTAKELLDKELIPTMKGWFEADEIDAAMRLTNALKIFQLWDEGNFSGAYNEWGQNKVPNLPLPTAVTELGPDNYWPQAIAIDKLRAEVEVLQIGQSGDLESSLYLDHNKLVVYAYDELDHRSVDREAG